PALDYEWGGDVSIIVGDNTTPEITVNGFNNTPGSDVYILTLTASDTDCSTTDDIQVTIIPEPVPNAGQDEEICYDEETQLDASGGADYLWEDNGWFNSNLDIDNPLVQPLETDTFVVTVFGLNGCGAMDSVILFVPEPFDIVTDNTPQVCFGICDGFIDVTPGGSYGTYAIAWDDPALDDFSETDVCAGLYTYTIFDENFCSTTGTVEILELAEPFIDDVLINTPNCFGDETGQLTVVEPTAVQFYLDYPVDSNATGVFSNLPAGNYSLMVLDVDGCYSDTLVSFTENSSQMFISTNFDTTLICVDTPIDFIANAAGGSGVLTYTWYDDLPPAGSQIQTGDTYTVIPQDTTVVYVLATDELGCTTDTLMMAAVFDTPVDVYTDPNGEPQICQGECLDMTAFPSGGNGNVQVTWVQYDQFNPVDLGNDLSITECPMEGTAYIVYADDGCSVVATDTVFVIVHETPDVEFEVNSYGECYPFTATFVNLTDTLLWGNCLWDFGNGDLQAVCDTISFTYFNPGTYNPTLTVTSEFGCTDTDSLDVPIFAYDYPVANFTWSPDPVSTLENHVQFINESIGAQTYFWDLSGFTQTTLVDPVFEFPVVDQISYIVCLEAINEFGCRDTICKDLLMESIMTVNVPNAFTPDSDGLNDTFFPVISGITDENYTFRIWDRWGAIVFETHDRTDVWTGGVGNSDDPGNYYVPNDVYIWEVECEELSTGEIHNFKGHVTIVR
ncbi:MAG: gliding motility-associated C-terminal domain-containing protein, partial [Flavobacteriales bacterium]|nr:gliding motility-associated C-terminal domain-containing protein [Flavobacteriales bacterium]